MGQLYGQFDESKSAPLPLFPYRPVRLQSLLCLGIASHRTKTATAPLEDRLMYGAEGVGVYCCMQTRTSGPTVCWLAI
jgi:hypothetical protein